MDTINKIGSVMPTHPFLTQDDPYDKRMICPSTCEKDFCMCVNMKHIKTNSTVRMYMHDGKRNICIYNIGPGFKFIQYALLFCN